jgi:hypothetical protein
MSYGREFPAPSPIGRPGTDVPGWQTATGEFPTMPGGFPAMPGGPAAGRPPPPPPGAPPPGPPPPPGAPPLGPPPQQPVEWQPEPAGWRGPGEWEEIPDWEERRGWQLLIVPMLLGSLVAVAIGVYARMHEPSGIAVNVAGFSGALQAKAWLGSAAAAFGLLQLLSSFMMYGRVPAMGLPPEVVGGLHRWSGRIAFLLAVPVAIHCLYAVGFGVDTPRGLIHSLLGCVFFGVFVVKMLGLRKDGLPGWALPTLGGLAFTALVGIWLTSSLWFFSTFGMQF